MEFDPTILSKDVLLQGVTDIESNANKDIGRIHKIKAAKTKFWIRFTITHLLNVQSLLANEFTDIRQKTVNSLFRIKENSLFFITDDFSKGSSCIPIVEEFLLCRLSISGKRCLLVLVRNK